MVTAKECLTVFGEPDVEFERNHMALLNNNFGGCIPSKIYCNKIMLGKLSDALMEIKTAGLLHMIVTWNGCFNVRKSRTSNSYSLHAWGIAIDINAESNKLGSKPTLSPEIVSIFKRNGFDWGGDWKYPDGMHFQLSSLG